MAPRAQSGVLVLGFLYILFVAAAAASHIDDNHGIALTLVSFVIHAVTLLLVWRQHAERYGVLSPVAYLAAVTLSSIMVRDTGLLIYGLDYHEVVQGSPETITALWALQMLLSWCAFVSMALTFHLFKAPFLFTLGPGRKGSFGLIIGLGVAFLALGLTLIVTVSGGVQGHWENILIGRSARTYVANVEGLGMFFVMTKMGVIATFYWLAQRRDATRQILFWIMVAVVTASSYAEAGSRAAPVNYILMLLVVWTIQTGKIPVVKIVLLACAGIVFIGAAQMLREVRLHGDYRAILEAGLVSSASSGVNELRERRGTNSASIAVVARGPSEYGYLWGKTYWSSLFRFVPRAIWPEKPIGIDTQVGINFWGHNVGKPPGGVAEAYWNLGIVGVILVYSFYGAFLKWIFSLALANRHRPDIIVMYVVTVCVFNPSQTGIAHWYFLIIPTMLTLVIAGLSIREPMRRAVIPYVKRPG